MKNLNIRQARQALPHLKQILATEGEIIITKRGEPVARLMQIGRNLPMPSHRDLRKKMLRMRKSSSQLIRADRDER